MCIEDCHPLTQLSEKVLLITGGFSVLEYLPKYNSETIPVGKSSFGFTLALVASVNASNSVLEKNTHT